MKLLGTMGQVAIVCLILAGAIHLFFGSRFVPATIPGAPMPPTSTLSKFATFCKSARLVPKAVADCQEMMAAAKTDEDRIRVERIFAMNGVKVDGLPKSVPEP